jgi:hypothetical protein
LIGLLELLSCSFELSTTNLIDCLIFLLIIVL